MDALLSIAIRFNYLTIISLICTCKYYSEYPNIWKVACEAKFPDKPYFDFWLGKENYLVHERKYFRIWAGFYHSSQTYWNRIIKYLNEISTTDIGVFSIKPYTNYYINFVVNAQFILVNQDCNLCTSLVGQYKTFEATKKAIQIHQLDMKPDKKGHRTSNDEYIYLIINLEHTIPQFAGIGKLKETASEIGSGAYYYGTPDNPINF
jgi:hypothetical protein